MNFQFLKLSLNKLLILTGIIVIILLVVFWFWWGNKEIAVTNIFNGGTTSENSMPKSSISGISCDNFNIRPIAVMLSSDAITRPLSGLGEADIVFEMPVTPGGVTRTMAVYQCEEPKEIGSVRSAREDFIPLAASLKATYAHWGGEHDALTKLNNGILDNIDAMKYETTAFFRKKTITMPHNGFTDL